MIQHRHYPAPRHTAGASIVTDLAKMPHLLVAGTTGRYLVGLNAMLLSLLFKASPEGGIAVDPKMLELAVYEGILIC